jgi:hypothetical protein
VHARVLAAGTDVSSDELLLDDEAHGGLKLRALRLVGGARRALWLADTDAGTYAAALDDHARPTALAPLAW